ncbi:hypothetical protein LJB98_06050, partial [Bacteroidales bacterium OttesenSCG-928-M11]|nr:hypothetical protein [Bacteroidales bacterium OttesenSCG-928-M11]
MVDILYISLSVLSFGITFTLGLCFLFLRTPKFESLKKYITSRKSIAIAYFTIAGFNLLNAVFYSFLSVGDMRLIWLSILSVASLQALLFTYTLITLIDINFQYKKKRFQELSPIVFFTICGIIAFYSTNSLFFNIAFYSYLLYYISQLIRYSFTFFRIYNQCVKEVDNFHSDQKSESLHWIKTSFILALMVGTLAVLFIIIHSQAILISFMVIYILFYSHFGIQFLNYPQTFLQLELTTILKKEEETPADNDKMIKIPFSQLEIDLDEWVLNKGFI